MTRKAGTMTTESARQKNVDLGLTTGIGEEVTEWIEYNVQILSLGAWHDLKVTLELAQAQVMKADFDANQLGYVYRIVEKRCKAI